MPIRPQEDKSLKRSAGKIHRTDMRPGESLLVAVGPLEKERRTLQNRPNFLGTLERVFPLKKRRSAEHLLHAAEKAVQDRLA